MKDEYTNSMKEWTNEVIDLIVSKDLEYNATIDLLDYFPKGWNSCYTFISENLNRLDSMISSGYSYEKYSDKINDLLAYVMLSHLKLKDMNKQLNAKKRENTLKIVDTIISDYDREKMKKSLEESSPDIIIQHPENPLVSPNKNMKIVPK